MALDSHNACAVRPSNHLQHAECEYLDNPMVGSTQRLTRPPQLLKYIKLDQRGAVLAEYIWIDGANGVRSKIKVRAASCSSEPPFQKSPSPPFNGSKTNDATEVSLSAER